MTVRLNREAATALLKEARRDFENGAEELYSVGDEGQRPIIEACVEVIGRLGPVVERWPLEDNGPLGKIEQWFVGFDLSPPVMAWIERGADQQAEYVEDLDGGASEVGRPVGDEPGYLAEQVYLLHVQRGVLKQREAVAA